MEAIVGTHRGHLIKATIDAPERGGRYIFDRVAHEEIDGSVSLAQLRADEFVISPGLIYRRG